MRRSPLPSKVLAAVLALVVLALVVSVAVQATGSPPAAARPAGGHAKVVGGRTPSPGAYPSQVAIVDPDEPDVHLAHKCGGTLIDPLWVLTAAHCFTLDGEPVDVVYGTSALDGSGHRVPGTAFIHPTWSHGAFFPRYDVALVRLDRPVQHPLATLAMPGMEVLATPGTVATVTGWGEISGSDELEYPVFLREAAVPIVDFATCDAELNVGGRDDLPDDAHDMVLCAGAGTYTSTTPAADACFGDSGGPLWATGPDGRRRQIGIVTGGPTCGRSPSYYQWVPAHIGFLETAMGRQLASYPDIPGNVHEPNIERVTVEALAGGFADGTFRPGERVSRGQLATVVASAMGLAGVADGPFDDTAASVHAPAINAVAAAGIVGGHADGRFRPSDPVTRGQLATLLARALDLPPVPSAPFSDTAGDVHGANIAAVAAAGIVGGFPDGTYRPGERVTRGQLATFLVNAFLG